MKHILTGLCWCFINSCPTVKINFTKYMWYPLNSGEAYFPLDRWLVSETPGSSRPQNYNHSEYMISETSPLRLKTFSLRIWRGNSLSPFQLSYNLPSHLLLKHDRFILIDYPLTDFLLSKNLLIRKKKHIMLSMIFAMGHSS